MNPVARFLLDCDSTKNFMLGNATHYEKIDFVK